jgi:hypothetical protein
MSRPILQLQNSANWQFIWSGSSASVALANGSRVPMPPIQVPILLENHTIAIVCTSATARPSWKIAGNVGRRIQTGLGALGVPDTTIVDGRVLRLRSPNLIRFEQLTATYVLEISPKFWLTEIDISIFAYTGIDSDTLTEQLNRIELDLSAFLR